MTDAGGEVWTLWRDGAHDAFFNMAADAALLTDAQGVWLRLYSWSVPAVSYGRSQEYPAELADRYELVRRPTGGGVVFHDGDCTYTLRFPPEHAVSRMKRPDSYRAVHEVVMDALRRVGVGAELRTEPSEEADRATMRCFVSPSRFDVLSPEGKAAGAAQRRTRAGLLHQGSVRLPEESLREAFLAALPEAFAERFHVRFRENSPGGEFFVHARTLAEVFHSLPWLHKTESAYAQGYRAAEI